MSERWRQALHLEPPTGWLNDPNGLCWFAGSCHVFFQYCPDSASGSGRKCWGHYESPDLLHWRFLGTPLSPDLPEDRSGVYSGSALTDGGTMRLYYTGNVKLAGNYDYILSGREANVLTVESRDGRTFSPKQVLLRNADYPADCSCHVRDPKVWKEGSEYFMVLGARSRDGEGRVLLYRSRDGLRWDYAAAVRRPEPFGYMWECPDFFRLEGREILSVSPQGLPHGGARNQNVYQSGWMPVSGPLQDSVLGDFTEWDMGFDFYAPQTFEAPDGRRMMLAWMGLPDSPYENPTEALGWQHCLTVPRELFFDRDGRLCQRPARELDALAADETVLPAGTARKTALPFRLDAVPAGSFAFQFDEGLILRYHADTGVVSLRFDDPQLGGGRTERIAMLPRCRSLRILADASSLECYLDGGAAVMTTRFYPKSREISLRAEGTDARVAPLRPMECK